MNSSYQQRPLVSVVVPAYNAERHIEATLASIQAQSVINIEILVVDDCSNDGTMGLVERISAQDPRVQYLRTPANCGGPAGPRNLGVKAARAEWLALCDADDLWHPQKLEFQLHCAKLEGANFVCSQVTDFHSKNPPPAFAGVSSAKAEELSVKMMLKKNRVATSSVLCHRMLLTHGNGFDTNKALSAVEDFDMWLRLLDTHDVRMFRIMASLVNYRILPGSLSANKWSQVERIMLVLQLHFERRGLGWLFPVFSPFLAVTYLCTHIWHRVFRGRM